MTRSTRTLLFHSLLAASLGLAGAGILLALFRPGFAWYWLLAAWLVSVNLTTFGYYAYDKSRARAVPQGRRVPEAVLHGLAGLGGTPGAYLGMVVLRHKTIKPAFRVVFWLTAVLQVLLVAALVYAGRTERKTVELHRSGRYDVHRGSAGEGRSVPACRLEENGLTTPSQRAQREDTDKIATRVTASIRPSPPSLGPRSVSCVVSRFRYGI